MVTWHRQSWWLLWMNASNGGFLSQQAWKRSRKYQQKATWAHRYCWLASQLKWWFWFVGDTLGFAMDIWEIPWNALMNGIIQMVKKVSVGLLTALIGFYGLPLSVQDSTPKYVSPSISKSWCIQKSCVTFQLIGYNKMPAFQNVLQYSKNKWLWITQLEIWMDYWLSYRALLWFSSDSQGKCKTRSSNQSLLPSQIQYELNIKFTC